MVNFLPFWKTRTLDELSPAEWESLCDGCGRCCLYRVRAVDSAVQHHTDVACRLLNRDTCRCGDYPNRRALVPSCGNLTPGVIGGLGWLPPTCGYRRVAEGRDLAWWHPLVSGDPETVHQAGISVRGRSIAEDKAGTLDYHVVAWPAAAAGTQGNPVMRWRAWFGGVNADLLTPWRPDFSADLDRMAAHAFRLIEQGCDGLRVLGPAGEGGGMGAAERIAILEGLTGRGVPASKLLPDTGAGEAEDVARVIRRAAALGCRGVIRPFPAGMKEEMDWPALDAVTRENAMALYWDATGVSTTAASALAGAWRASNGQIRGVLAAGGAAAALVAALAAEGAEILGDDAARLPDLLARGGAGCVSAIANIAPRALLYVGRHWEQPGAAAADAVIAAILRALAPVPLTVGVKALLAHQTGDDAWRRVRPPLSPLSESERGVLESAYARARARPGQS